MIDNQRRTTTTRFCFALAVTVASLSATPAVAQLRIASYNTATITNGEIPRAGMGDVLEALGIESKNGIQRPVDILSIQETGTLLTGAQNIVNILNGIYGPGTYARSTLAGANTGDGRTQAVIYNTNTVQLISQSQVGIASTSGAARAPMRFEFRPVGYDSTADFYVYSHHYFSSDATRREVEAINTRSNADALGQGTRIIYSGDFNIDSSSEAMYSTRLLGAGNGQAFDPINTPGTWHNNAGLAFTHTQAPGVTPPGGLTGGGMDDRFDFQLVTGELLQGEGMSYIGPTVPNTLIAPSQESYRAFGNNGSTYNTDINSGSNTALPVSEYNPGVGQPTRADALNGLYTASDHIPVVADYQLPAKMSATLASVPAQVIKDTPLGVNVNVSNVAPVAVAIGADELDYNYTASGSASGAGAGTVLALDPANAHALSLDTSTLGPQLGSVNVTGTSEQVANGTFNDSASYTVLDHAAGDFVAATGPQTLDIDFGTIMIGGGAVSEAFQLTNLPAAFRAGLDFTGFTELGDGANRFSTDLALFSNLSAGSDSSTFNAMFAIDQLGTFSATYLLDVADDANVFGGTGDMLTLNLFGTVVVPEPASCVMAAVGIVALVGYAARRRRCK
jgi:hypothetical protein